MHYSLTSVLIITVTFILAGMVKGMIGMGLPSVAMGILGLVMGPADAVALLVIPTLFTNVWQLITGPGLKTLMHRFVILAITLFIGAFFGVRLLTHTSVAAVVLGTVLASYGALGLKAVRFSVSRKWERRLSPFVGLSTGVLYGATGMGSIPSVPFLNSLGLDKDSLIQSLGLTFTICSFGAAIGLAATGDFGASVAWTSLFALVPACVGMMLGQYLRDRMKPEVFRYWFSVWMVVMGSYMVVHALTR